MLVAENYSINEYNIINTIKLSSMSRADIRRTKSFLNSLVEEANSIGFSIEFEGLEHLLKEYRPFNCYHHMLSCVRIEDARFELLSHMKSVEASTRNNPSCVVFKIEQ